MSKCPNCGTNIGCSCKLRKLENGKTGCTKCVNKVQSGTNSPKTSNSIADSTTAPEINNVVINK